jgi:hypothetical protein
MLPNISGRAKENRSFMGLPVVMFSVRAIMTPFFVVLLCILSGFSIVVKDRPPGTGKGRIQLGYIDNNIFYYKNHIKQAGAYGQKLPWYAKL